MQAIRLAEGPRLTRPALRRVWAVLLLAAYCGSTAGLPMGRAGAGGEVVGCRCSSAAKAAGNCCCQGEAAKTKTAPKGCCAREAHPAGCERGDGQKRNSPSRGDSRELAICSCGDAPPGGIAINSDPRLTQAALVLDREQPAQARSFSGPLTPPERHLCPPSPPPKLCFA